MPTTRKKVIKTVFKDDSEDETGDFSDSGSEAKISEQESSTDEDEAACDVSSDEEFQNRSKKRSKPKVTRKPKPFAKTFINKVNKSISILPEDENANDTPATFSVKDLTDADKLLPSVLNLSESDSSDDELPKTPKKNISAPTQSYQHLDYDSDKEPNNEYKDVFSTNFQANSEEIAKKAFLELELHKSKVEQTKASIQSYKIAQDNSKDSDVKDLLAQGGEVAPQPTHIKKKVKKRTKDDSDSDIEDWEEVKENKAIPQQGLQLIVDIPDAVCRKTKTIDVEMMMKRKINRVKKEYQIYMHKVHVLCWLGHGNYVSRVLNSQELLAAALSLVPSKECYPGERVDMKYLQQISVWYKDKITLKQDKHENKFRPKAPPLKDILRTQIKSRVVTTKKYMVFIFVSMLRALGLQCRVMFNFVTLPLKPPTSELCSLSTKPKIERKTNDAPSTSKGAMKQEETVGKNIKRKLNTKISQVDGNFDYSSQSNSELEDIIQLDGSNDVLSVQTRKTKANKTNITDKDPNKNNMDVSPPKRSRRTISKSVKGDSKSDARKIDTDQQKGSTAVQNNNMAIAISPLKKKHLEEDIINMDTDAKKDDLSHSNKFRKSPISNIVEVDSKTDGSEMAKATKQEIKENAVQNNNKRTTTTRLKTNLPKENKNVAHVPSPQKTKSSSKTQKTTNLSKDNLLNDKSTSKNTNMPAIVVSHSDSNSLASKYFGKESLTDGNKLRLTRKRSQTATPGSSKNSSLTVDSDNKQCKGKSRTKSAPGKSNEKSKYFSDSDNKETETKNAKLTQISKKAKKSYDEDKQRVSHRDIHKMKSNPKNDVTKDLINIIKNRVKEAKEDSKKGIVKGKIKKESDEDSDYLPEEKQHGHKSDSDDDFKPTKISPKPSTSRKPSTNRGIDRRVLSSDEESSKNKADVWCEVYVEELEQWISIDIMSGKLHCPEYIYRHATHPVGYVVGWDNNNYLKDLTRRYVPQWNTVTRKQRAESEWWNKAIKVWLGPKTARDREEDENLDRMQLDAPLPKSISEYKNHPLYALKRHLLKFEAIYPPDAATLGFVRGEPVYARECVYICRSRDTWLKEAKVVRLGEQPYKVVKARPKWDKLSNQLITDKPLEVFGPWQVQDYEPPVAENGIVPRNAYGNVELFKDCMLPKGTVHIKLPGLNKVARKLNIDCAPAMTGFDFNGGWSHPVYDGFVVCQEFEELITDAWVKDQEEQERREREKTEARVYGNWRRLIKGLFIRERLKCKYGFEDPSTSKDNKKKNTGPRLVVKKKNC